MFPTLEGRAHILAKAWDAIKRRAAILDVRLHDLRHSFASVAIMDGISLLRVGKLLGHALPETTARYAHLADAAVAEAAARASGSIAAALGRQFPHQLSRFTKPPLASTASIRFARRCVGVTNEAIDEESCPTEIWGEFERKRRL